MLKREQSPSFDTFAEAPALADSFQSVLEFLRRQFRVIAVAVTTAVALGLIYALTTPPMYTATASLMIDTNKVQLFQQHSMFSDMPLDAGMVESQVEILKSETIALAAI